MIDIDHEIERATIYFRDKAKRENRPPLSHLYVILDHGGGWRFVITQPWEIRHHLTVKGERAIVVPKIRIAEPVEWEDIARTITLAERYVAIKLSGENACGGCRVCCVLNPVQGKMINKPAGQICSYMDSCVGGCRIYPLRPQPCKDFECEWLISQRLNDKMPPELRPDRCGVMFSKSAEPETIDARRDWRFEGDPFENEALREHIAALEKFGLKVNRP